jgi:ATP-binding protein involved in chromosome partitioning
MERRDKSATPPPRNNASTSAAGPAAAASHAHGHSHSHTHSHGPRDTGKSPSGKRPIAGVRRVIAVASGKGGVGKSTVSVNLALALHNQGYKVGILDADIYGPSLPLMLGVQQDPQVNEQNKIIPPEGHGLKVMSFGFFAPEESAVIWRGPMVMKALQQFFYDVEWGELDFLVIDLPPGTGDAQLTLVQSLPIAGAVIVTTPQNVALLDAVKGIIMFQKTEVPILGVVENMASFHCPSCGVESHIFGEGGANKVSQKFEVPVLGHVPLMPELREAGDSGAPLTAVNGHPVRIRFAEIAEKAVKRLVELEKGV